MRCPISDLPPSRLKKSSAALLKFPAYLSKSKPHSRPRVGDILDSDVGALPENLGVSNYESNMLQQKLGHVNSKLYDNGEDKVRMKETLSEPSLNRLSRNFYLSKNFSLFLIDMNKNMFRLFFP